MIRIADLFCGAGGATTGIHQAADRLGLELDALAINHWPVAIETHQRNYPNARHLCMGVEAVDPRAAVPGGHLDLLVAGAECTHHSNARGGRPMNDQSRASVWNVMRWCELLTVDRVLIENVPEFQGWGPLDTNMRPIKSRKGETYRAFLASLESLGYVVEARILNAADYGDATTRRRLFIQAARGNHRILWPTPTHAKTGGKKWKPAKDIIDWTLPSRSIFDRTKPLADNTLKRIQTGLERFGGKPFTLSQQSGGAPRLASEPVQTIAAKGAVALVEPFVVQLTHGGRLHSIDDPLPTIPAGHRGEFAVIEPFIVPFYGERPGQAPRTHSVDEPLPTLPASPKFAVVEPFTMPYYSNGGQLARPVSRPLGTVTTKGRFALVIPDGMDVKFRMLQPHELSAAMGFPKNYQFAGNKTDIIRQVGNAWACHTATALCSAILETYVTRKVERKIA